MHDLRENSKLEILSIVDGSLFSDSKLFCSVGFDNPRDEILTYINVADLRLSLNLAQIQIRQFLPAK